MHAGLEQHQDKSLLEDARTVKKLEHNFRKNKEQDHTRLLDAATGQFNYAACANEMWNPERFSLLYATPLWDGADTRQRVVLNQLYWVAYYSQIISAEIATIFFNQTAAAGLFGMEDFRLVCDTLDLESMQERAHINAFKSVAEEMEHALFGERLFTYPMRNPYAETMIFPDSNRIKSFWKGIQLRAFNLLSSGNAFIGCQYFLIRGVRTLNGKLVQHDLSQYYMKHPNQDAAPVPSKISYFHFMDESYHFNSSGIISHDVVKSLPDPTAFERNIVNMALKGCQRDHFNFSVAINGIFWFDPALYQTVYRLLRGPVFNMDDQDAREMMRRCFCEETQAIHHSHQTHTTARESYKAYLADMPFVDGDNRELLLMGQNNPERALKRNRAAFERFGQA